MPSPSLDALTARIEAHRLRLKAALDEVRDPRSLEELRNELLGRKRGAVMLLFEELKAQGLVKHICVSSHMNGDDIGGVLRDYPFEGVLLGWPAIAVSQEYAGEWSKRGDAAGHASCRLNRR